MGSVPPRSQPIFWAASDESIRELINDDPDSPRGIELDTSSSGDHEGTLVQDNTDAFFHAQTQLPGLSDFAENKCTAGVGSSQTFVSHQPESRALRNVQISQLAVPRSQYLDFSPLSTTAEQEAVRDLQQHFASQLNAKPVVSETKSASSHDHVEFLLSKFVIYMPDGRHHPLEMRGLQFLTTKYGHMKFMFDGILSFSDRSHHVQGVPFKICSVGNYGEEHHTVADEIWIQSESNLKANVFYRLGEPSPEYKSFHEGFLWIANLGKHFVDFSEACENSVSVHDFRTNFAEWTRSRHWDSKDFRIWYNKLQSNDFRRAVSVNIGYLFKESIGVNTNLRSLQIWNELLELQSVPKQKITEEMTIVTPYIHNCFSHITFGRFLKSVEPEKGVRKPLPAIKTNAVLNSQREDSREIGTIKIGDVLIVKVNRDNSAWKHVGNRWNKQYFWYAYVQGIQVKDNGQRYFDALWLYDPADTSCAKMKYPFQNEVFLSDNCTCETGGINEHEVTGVTCVKWGCHPSECEDYLFIRQTFLENERFVTLKESHKRCNHLPSSTSTNLLFQEIYPIGQTVLARPRNRSKSKHELEVFEVAGYESEGGKEYVLVKNLRRRVDIDGRGRPNELIYTDELERMKAKRLFSKCLVRFYSEWDIANDLVPPPYNRDGTGNAFYICLRITRSEYGVVLQAMTEAPKSLIEGYDPQISPEQMLLRGLDLFAGGGNFGRGLEEGGAVRMKWAVDYDKVAIHTYAANLQLNNDVKLFYGSVNDVLNTALHGNPEKSDLIPLPGDVDFISAGSPCQGFSTLNDDRNNEKGLRNQSMVASVAAYIDLYRPKYGILENVLGMASPKMLPGGQEQDVLSQLICAIVGMGYQMQVFVIDAWSCGSPQSRCRVFVSFAAPGLGPLRHPALSHSHPPDRGKKTLGCLSNGQPVGSRLHLPTPFKYVSAREATRDLPKIGSGVTQQCTPQPEHALSVQSTPAVRAQIRCIPVYPRGSSFSTAWCRGQGVMTPTQRMLFPPTLPNTDYSWGWRRVDPDKPFSTMVGHISARDGRIGATLHWDEHRVLSVMEGRRIQGFPDHEVIAGNLFQGWRMLGLSVSRHVALALGLALREAWMNNHTVADLQVTEEVHTKDEDEPHIEDQKKRRSEDDEASSSSKKGKHDGDVDGLSKFLSANQVSQKRIEEESAHSVH